MHNPGFFSSLAIALLSLGITAACGGDEDSGATTEADAAVSVPTIDAGAVGCSRELGPENASRFVVVARPYGDAGAQSSDWDVLELSAEGALRSTGETFTMRRATDGIVHFTPDGKVGIVAQDDGSLGVFRIDEAGSVTVLHEAFSGSFYATSIRMSAEGDDAYIIDTNWRENGGGVYRLAIGCDDSVRDEGLVAAGKLPRALLPVAGGASVVSALDFGDSSAEQDVHLVTDSLSSIASATVFPDRDAIVSSMAVTTNGDYALIGDGSGFSGVPNRVGIARIGAGTIEPVQVLSPLDDPFAIVTSPFDNSALVVSGFGDAIYHLSHNAELATPFAIVGELAYQGSSPELPADAVQITRGSLLGLVLIAETRGVRLVRFSSEGAPTDLGLSAIGESYQAIVGAIGVQP